MFCWPVGFMHGWCLASGVSWAGWKGCDAAGEGTKSVPLGTKETGKKGYRGLAGGKA